MVFLKKNNSNQIKVHEGNTGILYFENGEKFIPNYDVEKAIGLTLDILNIKNNDGIKVRDLFYFDGFNWASVILSDLFWSFCYQYIQYNDVLEEYAETIQRIDYTSNPKSGGRFSSIYGLCFGENKITVPVQNNIQYKLKESLRKWPNMTYLLKVIYKYGIGSNEFKSFLFRNNSAYASDLIFDVMHPNNFRTAYIEHTLDELGCDWVTIPGRIRKNYYNNENLFNYRYDISSFQSNKLLYKFVKQTLRKIELTISNSIYSYEIHKNILVQHRPKIFLSMDEANTHVFPFLYACKKNGIPTVGFQHGAYTNRNFAYSHMGLGEINFDWFDKILVWGDYWKNKLSKNNNLKNTHVITFGNKCLPFNYKTLKIDKVEKSSLNILFPYEFLCNSHKVGNYMNRLLELGHTIYFKLRQDENKDDEISAYHIADKLKEKIIMVEKVDNELLQKIDVIMGTQTAYIYELLPYKIPIIIPDTEFTLIDDLIDEGLAQKIKFDQLESLHDIVNNYEYKGREPEYYFSNADIKQKLGLFLNSYVT